MRRLLFLLFFFPLVLQGQLQLTVNDLPQPGDTVYFAIDEQFPAYVPEAPGIGIVWDFSGLYPSDVARNIYFLPEETPFSATFPQSNLALRIDFDTPAYSYFSQDSVGVQIDGITADIDELGGEQLLSFQDPQQVLRLPAILGDSIVDTTAFSFEFQEPMTGADLLLKSVQYSTLVIDASGDLIIPAGTFPALRQKVVSERVDSLFAIFLGTPVFVEDEVTVDTTYLWLSPAAKGIILNTDPNGNWLYYAPKLANLQAPQAAFTYEMLVGGDNSFYFFDDSEGVPFSWSWDFGDGTTSSARNPVHLYDTTGTYQVCLTVQNSAGQDSSCQQLTYVPTSVEKYPDARYWEVFPNPATTVVQFQYQGPRKAQHLLEVYSAAGQQLSRSFFYESANLNTQNWQAGLYFYRIIREGRPINAGSFLIN